MLQKLPAAQFEPLGDGGAEDLRPWPLDFGARYSRMPLPGLLGFPVFALECCSM